MEYTIVVDVAVGLAILVGIVGAVIQVIPSSPVIGGAVLVWALLTRSGPAWGVFVAVLVVLLAGTVLKILVPGKRLAASGVPNTTLVIAGLAAVAGWFVLPVVGILAFPVVLHLMEWRRLGEHRQAVGSTVATLKTVGLSILIELAAALVAASIWLVSLFFV
ncbi:DUF456 domain-containing protein [Schaalia sp. 19OD2882]|uniref:DUF456 domain-containing protein n=1 Tax=Schaalia sp. 19OD2882 TaxID=2794089 RepID=UPI001C1EE6B6|nr:DUF456 domain-containing protein [Schaalia sp. 19OD2882]QWW19193.1 DUF456 domain-containing protein [Schaalia sp. 19OD2882]